MGTQSEEKDKGKLMAMEPPSEHAEEKTAPLPETGRETERAPRPMSYISTRPEFESLAHMGEKKKRTFLYISAIFLLIALAALADYIVYRRAQGTRSAKAVETRVAMDNVTIYAREGNLIGLNYYRDLKIVNVDAEFLGKLPTSMRFMADLGPFQFGREFKVDKVTADQVYLKPLPATPLTKTMAYTNVVLNAFSRERYGQGGSRDWKGLEVNKTKIAMSGYASQSDGAYILSDGPRAVRLDRIENMTAADRMRLRFAAEKGVPVKILGAIDSTLPSPKGRKASNQPLFTMNVDSVILS